MDFRPVLAAAILAFCACCAHAIEPNNTFADSTLLGPTVRTVSDSLFAKADLRPDTLLGIRDGSGMISFTDDDGSPFGSGTASGAEGLDINPGGAIDFVVSGVGDDLFAGDHTETGKFQVFVNVYDSGGSPLTSFDEIRTLTPGQVQNFSYSNAQWVNGTYDAFIDNTIDSTPGDVDFFTFTGLDPGTHFVAKTVLPPMSTVDTYLGWFDDSGAKLAEDDESGGNSTALLQGTVPESGKLTFAVTGGIDPNFEGDHFQEGDYELQLEAESIHLAGDYSGDGIVNAADYVVWRTATDRGGYSSAADGNADNVIDAADYSYWRARYGNGGGGGVSAAAIPEPGTIAQILAASFVSTSFAWQRHRRVRGRERRARA
jgi:hypothetical protein